MCKLIWFTENNGKLLLLYTYGRFVEIIGNQVVSDPDIKFIGKFETKMCKTLGVTLLLIVSQSH